MNNKTEQCNFLFAVTCNMLGFLTPNAIAAFLTIYKNYKVRLGNEKGLSYIPLNCFFGTVSRKKSDIEKALCELVDCNIINIDRSNEERVLYGIDWEVVGDFAPDVPQVEAYTFKDKTDTNDVSIVSCIKKEAVANKTTDCNAKIEKEEFCANTCEELPEEPTISDAVADTGKHKEVVVDYDYSLPPCYDGMIDCGSEDEEEWHSNNACVVSDEDSDDLILSDSDMKECGLTSKDGKEKNKKGADSEYEKARQEFDSQNPYRSKPYLKSDEVEVLVNDAGRCLESPYYMYLHLLFKGIFEYYQYNECDENYDEHGVEVKPKIEDSLNFTDIEMQFMTVKEFSRISRCAWEELLGVAEVGVYETEEGAFDVGFDKVEQFNFQYMVDWKFTESKKGLYVSTTGFRDIEAEDIKESEPDRDYDEENGDYSPATVDRQYAAFLKNSDDSELNEIELFQKRVLEKFVVFDEKKYYITDFLDTDGEVMGDKFIRWDAIIPLLLEVDLSINKEWIYETINQTDGSFNKGNNIKFVEALFSFQRTQNICALRKIETKVTKERLNEALINPIY